MVASQREAAIKQHNPCFVSVLDVDHDFEDSEGPIPQDIKGKARYRGPLYFDFDAENVADAIDDTKKFMQELVDYDVDPDCVELFATGGRGFHIEIPIQCALDKVSADGIPRQPILNKEVAKRLMQDTLDLNIYSLGRGRLWRCPNVKRENGHYKVPITYAELTAMDSESYGTITSQPRSPIQRSKPRVAGKLATLWSKASLMVSTTPKKKPQAEVKMLEGFKGEWSPSMIKALSGEAIEPGVGFQNVATQLAITAHALGKTLDQFLTDSEGLCQTYSGSDSNRYNTYQKRRRELSRMYAYMEDHPSYTFSIGGFKSVLKRGTPTPELDTVTPELLPDEKPEEIKVYNGLQTVKTGTYIAKEGGLVKLSDMGFINPVGSYKLENEELKLQGYQADLYKGGKLQARAATFGPEIFQSRATLTKFLNSHATSNDMNDIQAGHLMELLNSYIKESKERMFTLKREGLNLVHIPGATPAETVTDVVWASGVTGFYGQTSVEGEKGSGLKYTLEGAFIKNTQYNSDLMNASRWTKDFESADEKAELLKYFECLLSINEPHVVAKLIGWFCAAHFTPFFRKIGGDCFPYLHAYGEAGAGKTQSMLLLMGMFYHTHKYSLMSLGNTTKFSMEARWAASSSIPFVLDEYKPRTMDKKFVDVFRNLLRNGYQASYTSKGGIDRSANGGLMVQQEHLTAPMVYLAEAPETETAIQERSVLVPMGKVAAKSPETAAFAYVSNSNRKEKYLSAFGKYLVMRAMRVDVASMRTELAEVQGQLKDAYYAMLGDVNMERPIYNGACVVMGLRLGNQALRAVLGEGHPLEAKFQELEDTILTLETKARTVVTEDGTELTPVTLHRPKSELAKVLDVFALMSTFGEGRTERLIPNEDYSLEDKFIDIRVRHAFDKYQRYCRAGGNLPLFDNEDTFMQALLRHGSMMGRNPPDSILIKVVGVKDLVVRLYRPILERDNVSSFRPE